MAQIDMRKAVGLLLAGAMVGAAVALLSAPQSGVRTRKDIRKFARKTVTRLDDLQGEVRDQVTDWVNDMSEAVQDEVNRARKLGAEGYEQVLHGFDNAKKCVDNGRSLLEQMMKGA